MKRFRYRVEALRPVLRGFDSRHLDQLREVQGRRGDLHDLEVLSAAFRDFMKEGAEWTTLNYTIKDPQFVGKRGFHVGLDSDSTQHTGCSPKSVTVAKE